MKATKSCKWPALLACGHDRLVSGAEAFAGWVPCVVCRTPSPGRQPRGQLIVRFWTIREVCRHAQ